MNRTPVKSSQIASIGYDAATQTLAVEFWNKDGAPHGGDVPGAVYHYEGVPAEAHAALIAAESVGKHFGAHIRGKFKHAVQEAKANG